MVVQWLAEIDSGDLSSVGGKGASLGELTSADLPVPSGFVVTTDAYREFINTADIVEELHGSVDIDPEDTEALTAAAEMAQEAILDADISDQIREEIIQAYREIGNGSEFVAVRSSATAEDLPDASFAGQQETFLNVTEEGLISRIKACWASLFTRRAIYYRAETGFDDESVEIAVVVQRMVDAEKSGVLFTTNPSTGDPSMIIEAAWGLGEGVVSGSVSPDNYVVHRESGSVDTTIGTKRTQFVRDPESGETLEEPVPAEKRSEQVLAEDELEQLAEIGEQIEGHYGSPQDVEWAIADGNLFILQSRPITTIDPETTDAIDEASMAIESITDGSGIGETADKHDSDERSRDDDGKSEESVLLTGIGSSPGTASGPARIVTKLDELDKVQAGDIIVTEMTTPDMVPAMKRAAGIVTNEGGMTSHAAIVARELGVPAVVGTASATRQLSDGQRISIDGGRGTIEEGGSDSEPSSQTAADESSGQVRKPMTATEVKVNVSIPDAAERAAATGADGVGLLRIEHMILSLNKTPAKFIEEYGEDAYVRELIDDVRTVADAFYPRPARVRTLDAPTDEFRQLEGGDEEPVEHNPMLGYRGIRRSIDRPEVFVHELTAIRRLHEMGYDNIELMFPLVIDQSDIDQTVELMERADLDPNAITWGVMIETPAAALCIDSIISSGVDFVSFGTNDLTQYTLAIDRNNERVADRFDELHPSVLRLLEDVISQCRDHGVRTSICGQAGSKPEMIRFLVEAGISSISANIDAISDVQQTVKRVEQRMILDSIR